MVASVVPDPIWEGYVKTTPGWNDFNPQNRSLNWLNGILRARVGAFNVHFERAIIMSTLVSFVAIFVFVVIAVTLIVRLKSKSCVSNREGVIRVTISLTLLFALPSLLKTIIDKEKEDLWFKRIPQAANASASVMIPMAYDTPSYCKNMMLTNDQRRTLDRIMGKKEMLSKEVGASGMCDSKDFTRSVKLITDQIGTNPMGFPFENALSDSYIGEQLCKGFVSVIADKADKNYWSQSPSLVTDSSILFDLGTEPLPGHTNDFWRCLHKIIGCNSLFPGLYGFVNAASPTNCRLDCIFTCGKWFTAKDGDAWICAKALLLLQAWLVTESVHLCMHKISELLEIACKKVLSVSSDAFLALAPFILGASSAEEELEIFLLEKSFSAAFSFVKEFDSFKRQLGVLLKCVLEKLPRSPISDVMPWWGGRCSEMCSALKACYKPILIDSFELKNVSNEFATVCHLNMDAQEMLLNALCLVSVQHSACTFDGARQALSGPFALALGMMQHGVGVTRDSRKWKRWRNLLPTRNLFSSNPSDFLFYLDATMATAFATGASTGPVLLDSGNYRVSDVKIVEQLKLGENQLILLKRKVQEDNAYAMYRPTWYYPTQSAYSSFTTLTSGTYI
jgi:hypothetical protein